MHPFPIDAVIAWVDGNDPELKAKRMKYATPDQSSNEDIASPVRYSSVGEINYCVASLLRFAPFLRKIFIVTDNQDPHLDAFLDKYFPHRSIPVEIVDHSVIFRGYEQYLPIFNSNSIETMLWRIPDLSEHWIYLNDDFMLVAPTTAEDYFDSEGRAICRADKYSVAKARFKRSSRLVRQSHKVRFRDTMLCAADLAGEKSWFPRLGHAPRPQRTSVLADFFESHPEALIANIKDKFRTYGQFNPQTLCYILGLRSGSAVMVPRDGSELYIRPKNIPGFVEHTLQKFDACPDAKFVCLNSIDRASKYRQDLCLNWIAKRLSLID